MLYARTGREALADSLFLRLEHIPDLSVRAGLYDAKCREHLAKEEYREAIRYAGLYRAVADSFYTNRRNKEIQEIQAEHDRMEMLYRNARLKNSRLLILLLSVCAAVMLVYTFGRYKQKSLRQYARLQAEITLLQAAFPAMKERLSDTCLLASLGMSVEEIAGIMQVDIRTVEHYMADVCRYVRFNEKGKKGFLEFLKAFSANKA